MHRKTAIMLMMLLSTLLWSCSDSGSGASRPDLSDGLDCDELIQELGDCDVEWISAPWDNIREACLGEYWDYFQCVVEQYDPGQTCVTWAERFGVECASPQQNQDQSDG